MASNFQTSCAYLIHDAAQAFRRRFGREIADLGFTQTHWRILGFLSRTGPLGQSQVADLLVLHKVPVGCALNELERDGWIVRRAMPNDRRAREVLLSPAAAPVIDRLQEASNRLETALLQQLDTGAAAALPAALRTIRDTLRDDSLDSISVADETAIWLLMDCARHLVRRLDTRLEELGFTRSQWFVLNALYHDNTLTQIDLARQLDMSPAQLGKQLDQLEADGWVERREDAQDRRVKRLDIAAEHLPGIADIRRRFDHSHNTLIDSLDDAARKELASSLEAIRHFLREDNT